MRVCGVGNGIESPVMPNDCANANASGLLMLPKKHMKFSFTKSKSSCLHSKPRTKVSVSSCMRECTYTSRNMWRCRASCGGACGC
jgi:hypothetical protein